MLADPETAQFCNNGDTFNGWIGPDMHFLFSTIKNGSDCCWVLTHPDEHDIDESWSLGVSILGLLRPTLNIVASPWHRPRFWVVYIPSISTDDHHSVPIIRILFGIAILVSGNFDENREQGSCLLW